jgi:hypothetical protein
MSEDPATAPAAPPAAGTAKREKYGAAFCAIRPLIAAPATVLAPSEWSWWACSPVKWTIFSADHGANPARKSTRMPEITWVTFWVVPEPAWPTPSIKMP